MCIRDRVGENKVRALNGVDLTIYRGEFCSIVGTSGSGKSTMLNMLAGLETVSYTHLKNLTALWKCKEHRKLRILWAGRLLDWKRPKQALSLIHISCFYERYDRSTFSNRSKLFIFCIVGNAWNYFIRPTRNRKMSRKQRNTNGYIF